MSKIKLIATDIDGTILKHNFGFNPEIKSCIKRLSDSGVKVVLVTGRMHSATDYLAAELGLDTPIVSYQGGLIMHEGEILYERNLDPEMAREILNWGCKNNVHFNLYMNDLLYSREDNETIRRYTGERCAGYIVESFDNIELKRINKLLAIDFADADKVTQWNDYLSEQFPNAHIVKSTPYFCEISHMEARKSNSVEFLINHWGLKREEVLTIGDQNNDIDLLSVGGIKVAMGNATKELKAIADYVTDTVENNGFVKAIEKFVEVCDETKF